jgi:hypothetical protein
MIKPTVGRKVWYRPSASERSTLAVIGDQPLDATIVAVHNDNCVNLVIFDANGTMSTRCSAYLKQDDALPTWVSAYAEWMPYQVGQAKKDEQPTSGTVTLESPSAKDWNAAP